MTIWDALKAAALVALLAVLLLGLMYGVLLVAWVFQ